MAAAEGKRPPGPDHGTTHEGPKGQGETHVSTKGDNAKRTASWAEVWRPSCSEVHVNTGSCWWWLVRYTSHQEGDSVLNSQTEQADIEQRTTSSGPAWQFSDLIANSRDRACSPGHQSLSRCSCILSHIGDNMCVAVSRYDVGQLSIHIKNVGYRTFEGRGCKYAALAAATPR